MNPFTKDNMLSRTEDRSSLANHCLWKLHQAMKDFRYEDKLTEEHNERRFINLAKTYMHRQLIDLQYAANLGMRKPKAGLYSIQGMTEETEDCTFEPPDRRQHRPDQLAYAAELRERLMRSFNDDSDERIVIDMMLKGYTTEGIARRTGYPVSRVSFLIYQRVQPALRSIQRA